MEKLSAKKPQEIAPQKSLDEMSDEEVEAALAERKAKRAAEAAAKLAAEKSAAEAATEQTVETAPVAEPATTLQEDIKRAAAVSEAQAAEEAARVLARIEAMPNTSADQSQMGTEGIVRESVVHESLVAEQEKVVAEKIPDTWDELGVDKGKLEKILLTDELTAVDAPDAAKISDEARAENRRVRAKAEEGLFKKLASGTLSAEERALLVQHVSKKTAWTHPSGFIPEAAQKDEEVMRAVAQGSPAGARWAKDLGFQF